MERMTLSDRDFKRAVVLGRLASQEISSAEAGELLGLSTRQVKRLRKRFSAGGVKAILHLSQGRRSNRSHEAELMTRVLGLIRDRYSGSAPVGKGQRFGPTLVAEHLLEDEQITIPVSTLTRWMKSAGLWSRRRRRKLHRRRRERMAHFGELVQLDGSFHDWFEGRGGKHLEQCCLMTMTDDATGTVLARFSAQEDLWSVLTLVRSWIEKYGVPRAFYTDWKNVYRQFFDEASTKEEHQFSRICQKLGIEVILASSPQAKGRVERTHGTSQDRLVKKMRLKSISTLAEANEFLKRSYLRTHNAKFAKQPRSAVDFHTKANPRLMTHDVWCKEKSRRVSNDGVISYFNRKLQLNLRRDMPERATVLVRETEDRSIRIVYRSPAGRENEIVWHDYLESRVPQLPKPRRLATLTKPSTTHPWRLMNHADAAAASKAKNDLNPAPQQG